MLEILKVIDKNGNERRKEWGTFECLFRINNGGVTSIRDAVLICSAFKI